MVSKVDRESIAALVITYNEEKNIEECLESVNWINEIIVIDACSTDRTVEIARQYTDKVFLNIWNGFGQQKNLGIEKTMSEWVLIVDADERVSPELRYEIEDRLSKHRNDRFAGYQIPRRNYFYGKWIRWGGSYPDYQLRLFRKDSGRYNDVAIHENLILDGPIGYLKNHIDHITERCIADHFKKFDNYTTLAAQEKRKRKKQIKWYDIAFRPIITFIKVYISKQGYRDGLYGLIYGIFASFYTFSKYVKLWEMRNIEKYYDAGT